MGDPQGKLTLAQFVSAVAEAAAACTLAQEQLLISRMQSKARVFNNAAARTVMPLTDEEVCALYIKSEALWGTTELSRIMQLDSKVFAWTHNLLLYSIILLLYCHDVYLEREASIYRYFH